MPGVPNQHDIFGVDSWDRISQPMESHGPLAQSPSTTGVHDASPPSRIEPQGAGNSDVEPTEMVARQEAVADSSESWIRWWDQLLMLVATTRCGATNR